MTHILLFPPGSVVTLTKLIIEELVSYLVSHRIKKNAPAIVEDALLSPTSGRLFLLLLINFWCCCFDFAGTSERAVN